MFWRQKSIIVLFTIPYGIIQMLNHSSSKSFSHSYVYLLVQKGIPSAIQSLSQLVGVSVILYCNFKWIFLRKPVECKCMGICMVRVLVCSERQSFSHLLMCWQGKTFIGILILEFFFFEHFFCDFIFNFLVLLCFSLFQRILYSLILA